MFARSKAAPGRRPGASFEVHIMERPFETGIARCCPNCGHNRLSVRVATWADFKDGNPHAFDPEDIDYVEPIAGETAICRFCDSTFTIVG